jgi:hypothetical protein
VNRLKILIISDSLDFTTDYVCLELERRSKSYIRINRDKFMEYSISFDINNLQLKIKIGTTEFIIAEDILEAVYYRAPIYLHHTPSKELSFEEQLYRFQWTAFIRNLTIFEGVVWLNGSVKNYV